MPESSPLPSNNDLRDESPFLEPPDAHLDPGALSYIASNRAEYLQMLRDTVDRLERDNADRADLKLLARSLKELRYAFTVYGPYRKKRKITVFGSARTPLDHPDYESAVELGRRFAELDWMVVTGAGGGVMEAAHVGAGREHAMGLNIRLPFEQSANAIIQGDPKLVTFRYFFTRKLVFAKEVDAIAVFPGGFGTMDELFELLTLVQTGKRDLLPIVLIAPPGETYWTDFITYIQKHMLDRKLISPADLSLLKVTDCVDEALTEILDFYRVYQGMRFVRDRLVLRLRIELTDEMLAILNADFSDIVARGTIERAQPHAYESDDPATLVYPRISFIFNRHQVARLRLMIDRINGWGKAPA